MDAKKRYSMVVGGWAWVVALGLLSGSAGASPMPFSTSGTFDLPSGPVDLVGRSGVMADGSLLDLGEVPAASIPAMPTAVPFHLKFAFEGFPAVEVSGTIPTLGYNPDLQVQDVAVSTTATPDQIGLYPELIRQLIAHPDWLHTSSFRGDPPTMAIGLSVHPEDLNAMRPVPEPSTAVIVAAAFTGLAWKARRRFSRLGG